jgi:DNA-binding transcriptional regulator YiaG
VPIQGYLKASPESSKPYKPSEISLHSLRKRKGFSQSQLALSLGVSRNRVANWESGRSEIPDDVLKKLS